MSARKKTDPKENLRLELLQQLKQSRSQRIDHFVDSGRLNYSPVIAPQGEGPLVQPGSNPQQIEKPIRKPWYDRLLVMIEVMAVILLFFLIINSVSALQNLNQEFASALAQPTITPTPLISAAVLPSGHTFSEDGSGIPMPNESEVPEHLRPIVQAMAAIPIPTQSPANAVRIQIPAIKVDAPIVMGDGWEQLKKGVGQHIGSPNPGDGGNLILSAHNDIYGELFRDLDRLQPGDIVKVFTNQLTYEFVVYQTQIVEPTFVEVLRQTNESIVTLISCYPYGVNNQRIVVTGQLK
jgi:sortase A